VGKLPKSEFEKITHASRRVLPQSSIPLRRGVVHVDTLPPQSSNVAMWFSTASGTKSKTCSAD
jgi:hypothetical protein